MKNLFFFIIIILQISCTNKNETQNANKEQKQNDSKINGVTFVATRDSINDTAITPLKNYHANYAAIVPYAWMKSLAEPTVNYNEQKGWWGEKPQGVITTSKLMKEQGIKVLLKPQIWIGRGDYTGDINLTTHAAWQILESTYTDYIMRFAHLAAQQDIELFCIGTELDSFVRERPEYWQELIKKIRKIYKGKLTYAANWDNYQTVPFWQELDYIGVDAYFPISDQKTPDLIKINTAWDRWKLELSTLSRKRSKQILFTEYGYISADYAGLEPWKNAGIDREVNQEAQHLLFKGLFNAVWDEDWMAGGFIWKHHAEASNWNRYEKRFTPQNKKAQQTIAKTYKKYSAAKP